MEWKDVPIFQDQYDSDGESRRERNDYELEQAIIEFEDEPRIRHDEFTTFKQEEEIPWNQPATSQALEAIENSEIAIVVISKNYAASISCLDELAMIMDCKDKQSLVVIPVLYEVDPSDILRQGDDIGDGDNNNLEKVKKWKDALAKAIQIYQQDYSCW